MGSRLNGSRLAGHDVQGQKVGPPGPETMHTNDTDKVGRPGSGPAEPRSVYPSKAKRQYLITFQVKIYWLSPLVGNLDPDAVLLNGSHGVQQDLNGRAGQALGTDRR